MQGRRSFLSCSAALALTTLAARRAYGADDTERILEQVAAARRDLRTMVGSFEQVRRIAVLATDVTSRGRMTLVRPDRLRWELLPPDSVTYWIGPEGLAYATETSRGRVGRAEAGSTGRVLDDLLVVLGGDLGVLRERHEVRAVRDERGLRVEARPRDDRLRGRIRKLEVLLARDMVTPVSVLVQETETEQVRIRFTHVERNVQVDASTMRAE